MTISGSGSYEISELTLLSCFCWILQCGIHFLTSICLLIVNYRSSTPHACIVASLNNKTSNFLNYKHWRLLFANFCNLHFLFKNVSVQERNFIIQNFFAFRIKQTFSFSNNANLILFQLILTVTHTNKTKIFSLFRTIRKIKIIFYNWLWVVKLLAIL